MSILNNTSNAEAQYPELYYELLTVAEHYGLRPEQPAKGMLTSFKGRCPICATHRRPSFHISLSEDGRLLINCLNDVSGCNCPEGRIGIKETILQDTGVTVCVRGSGSDGLPGDIQKVKDLVPYADFSEYKRREPSLRVALQAIVNRMCECKQEVFTYSVRQWAEEAGLSEKTIRKIKKILLELDWLEVVAHGTKVFPNTYRLHVGRNIRYTDPVNITILRDDSFRHCRLGGAAGLVYSFIKANSECSVKEIASKIGRSQMAVSMQIKKLISGDLVVYTINTINGGGSLKRYTVKELNQSLSDDLTQEQHRRNCKERQAHLEALSHHGYSDGKYRVDRGNVVDMDSGEILYSSTNKPEPAIIQQKVKQKHPEPVLKRPKRDVLWDNVRVWAKKGFGEQTENIIEDTGDIVFYRNQYDHYWWKDTDEYSVVELPFSTRWLFIPKDKHCFTKKPDSLEVNCQWLLEKWIYLRKDRFVRVGDLLVEYLGKSPQQLEREAEQRYQLSRIREARRKARDNGVSFDGANVWEQVKAECERLSQIGEEGEC